MNQPQMTEYEMANLAVLNRIASALETLAMSNAKAPNLQRPIESYATFDFDSIGAQVKAHDEFGATTLDWGGFIWTRRSPQNKFGEAIWFSRPIGKKEDGSNEYARLITFKKFGEAEPLPRKVEAIVEKSAAAPSSPSPLKGEGRGEGSELDKYFGPNPRATLPADQVPTSNLQPPTSNGNGLKPIRPIAPDKLKEFLARKSEKYGTATASPQQRGLACSQLEQCFAGDMDSDLKRHAAQIYLLGAESFTQVTDAQALALLDWLKPAKDSGGAYVPDSMAAREAALVVKERSREPGQQELFPEAA